ncbi:MAG: RsmE family RNA methyltransferase [Acidobacteriota bacterium]
MTTVTLLIDPEEFRAGRVVIRGDKYKHLFRVRRLATRSRIRVVDGEGNARWGAVGRIDSKTALVEIQDAAPANELSVGLEIFVVPPKPQRLKILVEKATELGVTAIRIVSSRRVAREVTPNEIARLKRIASAAVEQSQRSRVPDISGPHSWSDFLSRLSDLGKLWVLDPGASDPLEPSTGSRIGLLVGPEGGFSEDELCELVRREVSPVNLGPTILRTETAAIVGSALLLHRR